MSNNKSFEVFIPYATSQVNANILKILSSSIISGERTLAGRNNSLEIVVSGKYDLSDSEYLDTPDEYYIEDNEIYTSTNSSGGIIGGISNGMPIISRIAVKPTPSISKCQKSVNLEKMEAEDITIHGRHDPCICPRATVVAQSSVAIVLADHMIRSGYIHPSNLEI